MGWLTERAPRTPSTARISVALTPCEIARSHCCASSTVTFQESSLDNMLAKGAKTPA